MTSAPPSEDSGPVRPIAGDLLNDFFPEEVKEYGKIEIADQVRSQELTRLNHRRRVKSIRAKEILECKYPNFIRSNSS